VICHIETSLSSGPNRMVSRLSTVGMTISGRGGGGRINGRCGFRAAFRWPSVTAIWYLGEPFFDVAELRQ
jgi:hypothetical protein